MYDFQFQKNPPEHEHRLQVDDVFSDSMGVVWDATREQRCVRICQRQVLNCSQCHTEHAGFALYPSWDSLRPAFLPTAAREEIGEFTARAGTFKIPVCLEMPDSTP